MWQEVQIKIADVKFGARDAKEKNKVYACSLPSKYFHSSDKVVVVYFLSL